MAGLRGTGPVITVAAAVVLTVAVAALALSRPDRPGRTTAASPTATLGSSLPLTPTPAASTVRSALPSDVASPPPEPPTPSHEAATDRIGPWTVIDSGRSMDVLWSPDGQYLLSLATDGDGPPEDQVLSLWSAEGDAIRTYLADEAVWLDEQRFLLHHWKRELAPPVGDGDWMIIDSGRPDFDPIGRASIGEVGSDRLDEVDVPPHGTSSGHGALFWQSPWPVPRDTRFRAWTATGFAEARRGYPMAWSREGDKLAILHPVEREGVAFASSAMLIGDDHDDPGSPAAGIGGPDGWIEVLSWPQMDSLVAHRHLDVGSTVSFDPSGDFLESFDEIIDLATGRVTKLENDDEFGYWSAWDSSGRLVFPDVDGDGVAYGKDGREVDAWPGVGESAAGSTDGSTIVFHFDDREGRPPLTVLRGGTIRELEVPTSEGQIGDAAPAGEESGCDDPLVSPDGARIAIVCSVRDERVALITEL